MNFEGYNMPDDLYYHKEFMWCRVEGDSTVVGLIDFTQQLSGDISFVEMPLEGDAVSQNDEVGTVETGKWVGKLFAPISGTIESNNEKLYDDPTAINQDPYGEGWIFKINMSDPSELDNLMKIDDAIEWLKGEIEKNK
ncbi:MAG: glycine cleavage system protein H [Candidatus Altiarchaeales archaeon ex4484_2]|nr:MAG: glycine cleavage system protein H [Candidatus Altiarchaeales archaeon ex4484_2]